MSARTFGDSTFRLDDDIEAVAVSPSGASIAIASDALNGDIRVLDAATGAVRFTFPEPATSLAFADDTTLWSAYAQLHRWHLGETEPVFTSGEHGAPLAIARGAGLLAVARRPGDEGSVDVLSLADGAVILALPGPGSRAMSLAFSPDGKRLAIGYAESAAVFELADRGRRHELPSPARGSHRTVTFTAEGRVLVERAVAEEIVVVEEDGRSLTLPIEGDADASALSPSSARYAVASGANGIRVFDLGARKRILHAPRRELWGPMTFVSEFRLAAASSHRVHFVDTRSGAFEEGPPGHDDGISAIALSVDGAILATGGGFDRTIRLWRTSDGAHLHALRSHENYILSLAFSPDGATLASGGRDGSLRLTDVATGRERCVVEHAHAYSDVTVAYSPRGELVTMGGDGDVVLRDGDDGSVLSVITRLPASTPHEIGRIAFDASGAWLACVGPREAITIFEAFGPNAGRKAFAGPADALALAFAPDEPLVAYRLGDDVVLAAVPSGREILRRKVTALRELALLPGRRLVLLPFGGPMEIFDAITGRARTVSLPSTPTVVATGPGDELFVGLGNTTAVVVSATDTRSASLAPMQALIRRLATRQELVGYRDAPMPATLEGDPSTSVITRADVTIHVQVDAEGDDGWVLRLALPEPDGEPAPPPPPAEEPSTFARLVAGLGELFGAEPAPAASPRAAAPRTFVARGTYAELPSAEQLEDWVSAFARG